MLQQNSDVRTLRLSIPVNQTEKQRFYDYAHKEKLSFAEFARTAMEQYAQLMQNSERFE